MASELRQVRRRATLPYLVVFLAGVALTVVLACVMLLGRQAPPAGTTSPPPGTTPPTRASDAPAGGRWRASVSNVAGGATFVFRVNELGAAVMSYDFGSSVATTVDGMGWPIVDGRFESRLVDRRVDYGTISGRFDTPTSATGTWDVSDWFTQVRMGFGPRQVKWNAKPLPSPTPTATPREGGASASFTFQGATYSLTGGQCKQWGLDWQVTLGDWHDGPGSGDFLEVWVVPAQGYGSIWGRSGGILWQLNDWTSAIGPDLHGTFSGTDVFTQSEVEGTFSC